LRAIAPYEIRDIEAHLRPSLNSLGSRISRNSADTTSGGLAERQAKLGPKRATGSEPHNKPDTELSVYMADLAAARRVGLRPLHVTGIQIPIKQAHHRRRRVSPLLATDAEG